MDIQENNQVINDSQNILSKTIITQKKFSLDSLNYNYINKYKLQKVSSSNQTPILKIKNLPCVMTGNQLKKITEIQYGDKKYLIQDVYILSSEGTQQVIADKNIKNELPLYESQNNEISSKDSQKLSMKKCCLFRKPKGKQKTLKRNTKNVAKNFCKAFLNYLKTQKKHRSDKDKIQHCIKQVKGLIGQKKYYNNNVIWKIISSNLSKQYFKIFLLQHAKTWIQSSKMQYKDVHFQAVDIYLNLYEKMTFLQGDQEQQDQIQEQSSSK